MSAEQCCMKNCEKGAIVSCSCSNKIYLCSNHIEDHISSLEMHTLNSLMCILNDDLKPKVLQYLKLEIENIKIKMMTLMSFTTNAVNYIISETKNAIKTLKLQLKDLSLAIIHTSNHSSASRNIVFNACENIKSESKVINFKNTDLKGALDKIKTISSVKIPANKDKYAILFNDQYSTSLMLLNLKDFTKKTINVPNDSSLKNCGCCRIDKNKYFILGGNDHKFSNEAKILDTEKFTIQKQPSTDMIGYIGILYYCEEILCFGGRNRGGSQNYCNKYNIREKRWINIEALPTQNTNTSAVLVNDDILVCGYELQYILIYLPKKDVFAKSKFGLNPNSLKWIFENWIVCSNGSVYEINENNKLIERKKIKFEITEINSSGSFSRKDCIYIVVTREILLKINKKNGIVETIFIA